MKKIITTLVLLTIVFTQPHLANAQEATEAGTPNPEQTTQELKERIQRIVEEKSEQIKGVIDQLSQTKRGFIGQVERVTEESLTITNNKGTEIISLNEGVSLLKANQKITIDKIAVGDWLVVMGLIEDDTFSAKRILVSSTTLRPKNHTVALGTIIEQKSNKISLMTRKNEELNFEIDSKTEFQDQDGQTADSDDFLDDIQVLIVGNEDDDGRKATIIRSLVLLEAIQD